MISTHVRLPIPVGLLIYSVHVPIQNVSVITGSASRHVLTKTLVRIRVGIIDKVGFKVRIGVRPLV